MVAFIWGDWCVSTDAAVHSQDPHQQLLLGSPDWKSVKELSLNNGYIFLKFNIMKELIS